MKRFFFDEFGLKGRGWAVIGAGAVLALLCFIFGGAAISMYVGGNLSCAQTGAQLHLPSNYAFLSETCYLTLPDGSRIDSSNYVGLAGSKK